MNRLGRVLALGSFSVLTVAAGAAELEVGSKAPAFGTLDWLKGDRVDPTDATGKHITVVEFWATWCAPCVHGMPKLTELQKRYGDKGLRIVSITQNDPENTSEIVRQFVEKQGEKIGYAMAFDASGETYRAYMDAAEQFGIPTAFIVDKTGTIAWIGHPENAMIDAIEELVEGTFDLEVAKKLYAIDRRAEEAMETGDLDALKKAAEEAVVIKPKSIERLLNLFYTYADFLDDPLKARMAGLRALTQAADNPQKLAQVADVIIHPDDVYKCNAAAIKQLRSAIQSDSTNVEIRVAYFRALYAGGEHEEALRLAGSVIQLMRGQGEMLASFASLLASPPYLEKCGELALQAIEAAIESDQHNAEFQLTKFMILHVCKKDFAAAAKTGHYLIELAKDQPDLLNSFAWGLLTDEGANAAYAGKYNELALVAAERMRQATGGDTWSHLETLALAKFKNDSVEEAIALQKEAIEKADDSFSRARLTSGLKEFEDAKR